MRLFRKICGALEASVFRTLSLKLFACILPVWLCVLAFSAAILLEPERVKLETLAIALPIGTIVPRSYPVAASASSGSGSRSLFTPTSARSFGPGLVSAVWHWKHHSGMCPVCGPSIPALSAVSTVPEQVTVMPMAPGSTETRTVGLPW